MAYRLQRQDVYKRQGLVRAVVFGIYQYDVDAQLGLLFVQLAGYFEQYAYPCLLYTSFCFPFGQKKMFLLVGS